MATRTRKRTTKKRVTKKPVSKLTRAQRKVKPVKQEFEHLTMLAYGQNGRGKTWLGATAPKPIIIDCNEHGTMSVRNFPDVQRFDVEVWTDIDLAYWYLHKGDHDRQTVVIDTVSSLQGLCMKFVLGDEASRDPTKDPAMPSKREYGKVAELMKTEILKFRNLDMNVIFLAQERRGFVEEDDDEAPEIFPSVSPSIRDTLTASVDVIGRSYIKEVVTKKGGKKVRTSQYRLWVGPNGRFMTKDRLGLPKSIVDPNITRILDEYNGGNADGDEEA